MNKDEKMQGQFIPSRISIKRLESLHLEFVISFVKNDDKYIKYDRCRVIYTPATCTCIENDIVKQISNCRPPNCNTNFMPLSLSHCLSFSLSLSLSPFSTYNTIISGPRTICQKSIFVKDAKKSYQINLVFFL